MVGITRSKVIFHNIWDNPSHWLKTTNQNSLAGAFLHDMMKVQDTHRKKFHLIRKCLIKKHARCLSTWSFLQVSPLGHYCIYMIQRWTRWQEVAATVERTWRSIYNPFTMTRWLNPKIFARSRCSPANLLLDLPYFLLWIAWCIVPAHGRTPGYSWNWFG